MLSGLRLTTYRAGTPVETSTRANLLQLNLLPVSSAQHHAPGQHQPERDIVSGVVKLEVNVVVSLFSNTRIYDAFAEDIPLLSLAAPLPVELTAFTGRWNNGAADLAWSTALEKNSSHFLVERSTGGEVAFRAIGKVLGAGSSNIPQNYKLRIIEASTLIVSAVCYRLRQVDLDGTETFSPVVVVAVGKILAAPQLKAYFNPAPDAQAVQVRLENMPAGGGLVQLYSEMGQLVSQYFLDKVANRLLLSRLSPDLCHVVLRDAAGQRLATQRLVISGR